MFQAMAGNVFSAQGIKVFWFFSSEKNILPYFQPAELCIDQLKGACIKAPPPGMLAPGR
jgi:hypothetical protein